MTVVDLLPDSTEQCAPESNKSMKILQHLWQKITFKMLLIDRISEITENKYEGALFMLKLLKEVSPEISSRLYT